MRVRNAAGDAAAAAQPAPQGPTVSAVGVKPVPALISIAIGLAVRFLVPVPDGITEQAWSLFSIFLSTIMGECHVQRRAMHVE